MNIRALRSGQEFSARIRGTAVTGEIYLENHYLFLFQNSRRGCRPSIPLPGRFGCSWRICTNSDGNLLFEDDGVTEFGVVCDMGEQPVPKVKVKKTPRFMSDDFDSEHIYRGQKEYHCGVSYNDPKFQSDYHIGVELETVAKSGASFDEAVKVESNWFYMERDGSLGSHGIEIITLPLPPKKARKVSTWNPLCEYFGTLLNSWDNGSCGLHVHISKSALGEGEEERDNTFAKLLVLYAYDLEGMGTNRRVFGRNNNNYCCSGKTPTGDAIKALGKENIKMGPILVDKLKGDCLVSGRYHEINNRGCKTIEFRRGKGSLSPERIASIVAYCDLMVKYARRTFGRQSGEDFVVFCHKNLPTGHPLLSKI